MKTDPEQLTFYEGRGRIPEYFSPNTRSRSWMLDAEIEVPPGGGHGPIAVQGGDQAGWSVYLNKGVPTFCYNFMGFEYTYIRATQAVGPGRHTLRYEFEKTGKEPIGAGGMGRLFVDDEKVAEGNIERTLPLAYSLDEAFDIGRDKGSPVSEEYPALSRFNGRVLRVDFDPHPDFHRVAPDPQVQAEARLAHAI